MARSVTTQSVESKTRVFGSYTVFDLFFMMIYFFVSYGLMSYVHPKLRIVFMVFSLFCALFLTSKSNLNKQRRNYESIYYLLLKDISVYRPFIGGNKDA